MMLESDELDQLRATLRRFLAEVAAPTHRRALAEAGAVPDAAAWRRLTGELGISGLHLPNAVDGMGAGLTGAAVAAEEVGASLAPVPYLSSVQASDLLASLDSDEEGAARLLRDLAAGTRTATLALASVSGGWDIPGREPVISTWEGRLRGSRGFVLDADAADLALVIAQEPDGGPLRVHAVDLGGPGVTITAMRTMDITRGQARLDLADAPGNPMGAPVIDAEQVERALDRSRLLLAAEAIGVTRTCLEMAVEYAKVRVQFDRPIGSFQAVKHALADVYLQLERARAALRVALSCSPQELPTVARVTKLAACRTAVEAATHAIHVHGGMGFTWEHDVQLYYRRAVSLSTLLGTARDQQQALSEQLIA
jgi:alkylation response protein AidB-like acyl-CoA dehydrogenase